MTTVPRRLHLAPRMRVGWVPRQRQPRGAPVTRVEGPSGPGSRPVRRRGNVPRRTIPEPSLVRTGVSAVVGMVLLATLLGTVGGIALLWLGTQMLVQLR